MMRFASFITSLFLLAAATAASQQPGPPDAVIAGTVVHAVTGEPLAEVRVSLARTDTSLDALAQMFSPPGSSGGEVTSIPGEALYGLVITFP